MKAFHEVRNYDSDFMVWYSHYDNIGFIAHWHKEIELIYVRAGSAQFHLPDYSFVAKAGDLVFCDSGEIHYCDSFGMDNSLDFLIFDTKLIGSLYQHSNFAEPLVTKEQLIQYGLADRLSALLNRVEEELGEKQPFYQEIVTAELREFYYLLKRRHPRNITDAGATSRRNHMLYDLQQLLSYIDENYTENITLEYAAKQMNFSDSYFSKVFKKLMGINFIVYLNMVRVEQAALQLRNTTSKVTDIAYNCGFNNIRTFNREFREITGYTPTEYVQLDDPESYKTTYYNRKSVEQEFVENDSLTVVKN